ncbi:HAMP domain-containing protein [Trichlorobacter thiogenes]|uniref:histidine kinase n=1 Tax=Trichlorobacter thiogenes TaxID=115783 RepID=A0A1T4S174_9BACT|nr:ATP-binding protein [Trichlorobacter thiogenes]SKA22004.1 HAMP domain-containing protein [Trichlorobacter thiogenes]
MRTVRPSLTFSILASLACLLILTWLLFSLLAFKTAENDLYAQKGEHARMLLSTFVNQLPDQLPGFPEGMLPLNTSAAVYASKLSEERSFERLTLLDKAGKVIYSVGREGSDLYRPFSLPGRQLEESGIIADGALLVRSAQVIRNGEQVGRAGLILSLSDEQRRIRRTRQLLMTYFALDFILLLGLGAFVLSKIVVAPVNRLLSATEKITVGIYGTQLKVTGALEMARLADAFNAMSSTLDQKQHEVASHVAALEKVNQDLELAREEAVRSEKMASVGLLAAGTAHEIGTPLASVMGYAEILSQELEHNPAQADYLARIMESCGRIDRIVKGLLEYARPKPPVYTEVHLLELVQQTLELLQHQGLFKGIQGTLRTEGSPSSLMLDPHQLQQVLINLLINASDAMPQGGSLKLVVKQEPGSTVQLLEVWDTGAGIAPENLGKLFDPFFTTKAPGKGTGLGLAISARIVEGFGGKISVRSSIGKGSCFTVHLPVNTKG